MKLSMRILHEELEKKYIIYGNQNDDALDYFNVQVLDNAVTPIDNHVILIQAGCMNEQIHRGGYGVISIGEPDSRIYKKNKCIILPPDTSLLQVLSDIQSVFYKFSLWEEQVSTAAAKGAGLQELCDLSAEIFDNPILVYDDNLYLLAISNDMSGLPVWDYDEKNGKRTLPLDVLNDFKLNEEFQQTMSTYGAQMCSENVIGYKVLYQNFWVDTSYSGRICINELKRPISHSDYAILEYFTDILYPLIQKGKVRQNDKIKALEMSLRELLDGKRIDVLLFVQRLKDIGWNERDSYACVQIMIEDRDSKTFSANYTCNKLYGRFSESIVFPFEDSIVMIINLENNSRSLSEILSELKIFLREGLFKAGISRAGNDFSKIREYYYQTTLAFHIGEKIDPTYWYYHFEDYIIPAVLHETTRNISPIHFCDPGILALKKYDEKQSTFLYQTLKVYLDTNMNITHTSRILFVHRTTLLYRLERIISMIGTDLKNPEDRFRILLSYHMLEWGKDRKQE